MKFRTLVAAVLFMVPANVFAQDLYWVMFRDKGPDAARMDLRHVSAVSRERRVRTLGVEAAFDQDDLSIHPSYLQAVRDHGVVIRAQSRWLNAVSVSATPDQAHQLRSLTCVREIRPVLVFRQSFPLPMSPFHPSAHFAHLAKVRSELDYGYALPQLSLLNMPRVHDVWFDGTGITIGMLDNGYKWRTHEAMKNTKVLAEFDVINQDSVTENEPGDLYSQDDHGTVTFSSMAAFKPGTLIGPAFGASFLLGKTEVMGSETRIEEDYWVEGLEWLEARGASIVSSSLGYLDFDDGFAYSAAAGELDGKTAPSSRAAARAARLGVTVLISNGNDGPGPSTLGTPADADTVISVGAVTSDNLIAPFSSSGPTSDGRIKPDICATGVGVYCASKAGDSEYTYASGTSLSCPLAAGVAAIVRSARPDLTPLQVRDALRNTADNVGTPNNRVGWGTINAWEALLHHGLVISTHPRVFWISNRNVVAAYVLSKQQVDPTKVFLHYSVNGGVDNVLAMRLMRRMDDLPASSGLYTAELPVLPEGAVVRYYLSAVDDREQRTQPYGAPANRHEFRAGDQVLIGGEDIFPKSFSLGSVYPNPYHPDRHTTLEFPFTLHVSSMVSVEVFDGLGRRVAMIDGGLRSQGAHTVHWVPGTRPSGVYTLRLHAGNESATALFLIVR